MAKPQGFKKPKRPTQVADPQQVYNHANRFLGTDQAIRKIFAGNAGWSTTVAPPTMVLSAFAAELYLKCILIIETDQAPANIHLLHVLYRRLSHKAKRRIEELWDTDCRPKITPFSQALGVPNDLPNALYKCSAAFEKLRYAYENSFNDVVYYIGDFPWILARYIGEIRPGWLGPEPPPFPPIDPTR
jgi:hypothetical protein